MFLNLPKLSTLKDCSGSGRITVEVKSEIVIMQLKRTRHDNLKTFHGSTNKRNFSMISSIAVRLIFGRRRADETIDELSEHLRSQIRF